MTEECVAWERKTREGREEVEEEEDVGWDLERGQEEEEMAKFI